jgi:DUF2927 family protein
MRLRARYASLSWLAGALLLAGCAGDLANTPVAPPMPSASFAEISAPDSGASAELADYYARVQNGLLAQGLLRTDGGGPDVPFTSRDLVRNFLRVAFYEEYADTGGQLVARESASRMHRWAMPVTLSVEFGASIDPATRTRDTNEVTGFTRRLARVTGHSVRNVPAGAGNFRVFIVNEDERRALAPTLKRIMPNISTTALNTVVNLPRSTYCLAFATDPEQDGTYNQAVAVIRAEHPDLLRASCIHEEVAQGMGLSNDYALARPSIFNDDEEFGFLTTHDELLLKMLYDPRLRPGMREAEARPIVEQIARELMGGEV